jgi:hypothetical protein
MPRLWCRAFGSMVIVLSVSSFAQVALPQLRYQPGGKVMDHVKVVPVLWGPNVLAEVRANIGPFYKTVVTSSFFDYLSEYNTVRANGSQQTIGTGTAVDPVTITPSNPSSTISEVDVQTELTAQIAAGALPTPDLNTLYMVHFPPGVTLTLGGDADCSEPTSAGFCAYHSSSKGAGQLYRYGAMPDVSTGDCLTLCTTTPRPAFDVLTLNASHELFEAITDPDQSAMAWNDAQPADKVSSHAEIGDICAYVHNDGASISSLSGETYVVQREWSNQYSGCIISKNDAFSLTFSVPQVTVAPGSTVSTTVALGQPTNQPDQPVQVFVEGVPTGMKIKTSVQPQTVNTGQSTQLTLDVDATVPTGAVSLEVLAFGGKATIFKTLKVVVQPDGLTVTLPSSSASLTGGQSTQLEVKTVNSGNPKLVALVASGLPDGVTATFDPSTVNAGDSSTLTLSAAKSVKGATDVPFAVTGTAAGLSSTASGSLTVTSAGCSATGGGLNWLVAVVALLAAKARGVGQRRSATRARA